MWILIDSTRQWGDMTHAEQYSTSEPGATPPSRKKTPKRVISIIALAAALGGASTLISSSRPASADQISDAKAQAAAITAKIQATEAQIQSLTGQVTAADYRLSQLNGQIAASQAQMVKDQSEVTKDQGDLRTQAISDYTSSGTTNQVTQMFSSNANTSGIRSEYSSIATGNVTTTIDDLHTAQTQLQATQSALQQQQSQATDTRDNLTAAVRSGHLARPTGQADPGRRQRQHPEPGGPAAGGPGGCGQGRGDRGVQCQAGCGQGGPGGSGRHPGGPGPFAGHCTIGRRHRQRAVAGLLGAPAAPGRREPPERCRQPNASKGVPYVWGGESPAGFDCSGLVAWAYAQVGISLPHYSGAQYDDTTHIPLADIEPGDLLFYGPGGSEHVAMYVGGGSMIEAPYTGAVGLDHRGSHGKRVRRRGQGRLSHIGGGR